MADRRKILIVCIDGFGPEYLKMSPTPTMDRIAKEGSFAVGRSVVPSVTNINNISIITGSPPGVHGITSNYWFDRENGDEYYMESPDFLLAETVLQKAKKNGKSTALLTAKRKLMGLLNTGSDYSLTAEDPPPEMAEKLGPSPGIYTPDINVWLFKALLLTLIDRDPDVVYCTTTDYAMHKFAPDHETSKRHIGALDAVLGEIIDKQPHREIYVTADHGMSEKTVGLDVEKILAENGIASRAIPVIKDRYTEHHQNLGGTSYVYLEATDSLPEAEAALKECWGIEAVFVKEDAAERFELMADRIGDLLVLGEKEVVFGSFDQARVDVNVRSHGSLHENQVPMLVYGNTSVRDGDRNYDYVRRLFSDRSFFSME